MHDSEAHPSGEAEVLNKMGKSGDGQNQSIAATSDRRLVLGVFVTVHAYNLLKLGIICLTIYGCVTRVSGDLGHVAESIAKMALDRWIMAFFLVFFGASFLPTLRVAQKAIGREHRRLKALELTIDPNRESSGLTEKGRTPEGGD